MTMHSSVKTVLAGILFASFSSFGAAAEPASQPAILSKIPYLNLLFKNVSECCDEGCPTSGSCQKGCANSVTLPNGDRIGVDIDFDIDDNGACGNDVANLILDWRSSVDSACRAQTMQMLQRSLVEKAAGMQREQELVRSLRKAESRAAAAEAKWAVAKDAAEREAKLLAKLVEARVENAELLAKLKWSEEKQQLAAKAHATELQLASLKTELAEARATSSSTPRQADSGRRPSRAAE